jgi:hypothetical protein
MNLLYIIITLNLDRLSSSEVKGIDSKQVIRSSKDVLRCFLGRRLFLTQLGLLGFTNDRLLDNIRRDQSTMLPVALLGRLLDIQVHLLITRVATN